MDKLVIVPKECNKSNSGKKAGKKLPRIYRHYKGDNIGNNLIKAMHNANSKKV